MATSLIQAIDCADGLAEVHHDLLLSLLFSNFRYVPCVLQSQGLYPEGSIEKRVLMHLNAPNATKVYVCGPKETTNKLKTRIFLGGVPSANIYSDVFL